MVAKQILSPGLGADIDLQRADRPLIVAATPQTLDTQFHSPIFVDCQQQITEDITVQGVEHIVMFEPEDIRRILQFINQEGANHPDGILLGEKGQGVRPSSQINGVVIRPTVEYFTAAFLGTK